MNGCICSRTPLLEQPHAVALQLAKAFQLQEQDATADLKYLTQLPHAFGSDRQQMVGQFIKRRLQEAGLIIQSQSFTANVPNPAVRLDAGPVALTLERHGENIYAYSPATPASTCLVALASHYDTKAIAGFDYLGANDSGSSTAALVQQLIYLHTHKVPVTAPCAIIGIFFDGEEAVLPQWNDGLNHPAVQQDNTYGSRHAVSQLRDCAYANHKAKCLPRSLGDGLPLVALILMDMIGAPDLSLTRDQLSHPQLVNLATAAAKALGVSEVFGQKTGAIEDDHIPFRNAGIPSLNLIDFNHLEYWHQRGDEVDRLSLKSIDLAAKISLYVALATAANPQVLAATAD